MSRRARRRRGAAAFLATSSFPRTRQAVKVALGPSPNSFKNRDSAQMTHVIAQPCIDVKDKSCVDVCPVDCIHGEEEDHQLYINPDDCIDCTLCVDACPVQAIFAEEDLPTEWSEFTKTNSDYYQKKKA